MSARAHHHRQRGVALVLTLLLVMLLAAAVSRSTAGSATAMLRSTWRGHDLQHNLAVESATRLAAVRLEDAAALRELTEDGCTSLDLELGDCRVYCLVTDDAAKLGVNAFTRDEDRQLLERKLTALRTRMQLNGAAVHLRPTVRDPARRDHSPAAPVPRYVWYDQLLERNDPGAYFPPARFATDGARSHPRGTVAGWADAITCFGDGRVNAQAASPEILRVLLDDLDPALADEVIRVRPQSGTGNWLSRIVRTRDAHTQHAVGQRLATSSTRYALWITTSIQADQRRWYVVVDLDHGKVVTVYYQGLVQW